MHVRGERGIEVAALRGRAMGAYMKIFGAMLVISYGEGPVVIE